MSGRGLGLGGRSPAIRGDSALRGSCVSRLPIVTSAPAGMVFFGPARTALARYQGKTE